MGLRPRPHWGAYSAPIAQLFKMGCFTKEGMEWEGREELEGGVEGKETRGKRKGRGKIGAGKGGRREK